MKQCQETGARLNRQQQKLIPKLRERIFISPEHGTGALDLNLALLTHIILKYTCKVWILLLAAITKSYSMCLTKL